MLTPGVGEVRGVDVEDLPDRAETDRRAARAEEIADVVQFLAGPASSFANGETVAAKGVPRTGEVDRDAA